MKSASNCWYWQYMEFHDRDLKLFFDKYDECNYQRSIEWAREMYESYFRGVFMRNALSTNGARRNESGIVNGRCDEA